MHMSLQSTKKKEIEHTRIIYKKNPNRSTNNNKTRTDTFNQLAR